MNEQRESNTTQPAPIWLQILRPILVLGCVIVGFVAFDRIITRGTIFDGETTPRWSDDGIDIYSAREAARSAEFPRAESILKELIHKEPRFGEAHRMLGHIYLQQDRLDVALQHYQIARQYLPGEDEPAAAIELITDRMSQQKAAGGGSATPEP